MAKISYTSGVTLHIGDPARNEYLRQTIEVSDFDTELDATEQLRKVHEALFTVMPWVDERLVEKIEQDLKRKP